MLVLTRRSNDKIRFPQVGVTVHFLRIQSGQVKVGVDAPREITILRDEVKQGPEAAAGLDRQIRRLPKEIRHDIRNELHQVSIGLHLYKELMAASLTAEADDVFGDVTAAIKRLNQVDALRGPNDETSAPPSNTVLIVEDKLNEREMLANLLRLKNLEVVTVSDGDEAIRYFKENSTPGYMLIDMQMPNCDGATVLKSLHAEGKLKETKVFAISGLSPEVYGVSIGDKGVDQWFPKPLDPGYLLDAMAVSA